VTHTRADCHAKSATGEVELRFYEAARGGRRRVPYTARAVCAFCMAEPGVGCDYCGGSGEVRVERETKIVIPAGIEDGATVPLDKRGEHIVVRVRPQPRDPAILRVTAALGLVAALGFLAFLLLG
jgi:DnaJ-class molecular chaperone